MSRHLIVFTLMALLCTSAYAQKTPRATDFQTLADTLTVRLNERTGVVSTVSVSRVLRRGDNLDFYFTRDLGDYPWRPADLKWFKLQLREALPGRYKLGSVFVSRVNLDDHVVPHITYDGTPAGIKHTMKSQDAGPTVRGLSERRAPKGLDGRHIALWQSHGRYYNNDLDRWMWQRATVHRTVEDIFTQSYVLKYLIPMLENAGADVFTPRERDPQPMEYIIDNDASFDLPRTGLMRRSGEYSEKGKWVSMEEGFADTKPVYELTEVPFGNGTARSAVCSPKGESTATWRASVEDRGRYAVYVSYKSSANSSEAAYYTVRHLGGVSEFYVNQRRAAGTWVYLGTFEFGPSARAEVSLSSKGKPGTTVSADAVKIGGGMGKIIRGEAGVSGLQSSVEGALYSMPWYGVDSTITRLWPDDYTNDYADRGPWVKMMRDKKNIPFDLSLAFHSDAGITPGDSIVGTLAIYTLLADGSRRFTKGGDRGVNRVLCDYVQTQIVEDIRRDYDSEWSRRQLWNRSYSESRTSDVPAMLLELLSHQNFADMRYGLDPSFQFTVGRSVYKGILKFLADLYDTPYVVQPLPIRDFKAVLNGSKVRLSWTPTDDPTERTAFAKGYRVYTRMDDGAFNDGIDITGDSIEFPVDPGHVYSYKVAAWNDGGLSFPSEILSVGRPASSNAKKVMIINDFTRVSGPSWVDTPNYAGFDARSDAGVPYIDDITYVGDVYDFRRNETWLTDDAPGAGASYPDRAGETIAGNTFDYPYVHGRALLELGYSFGSASASAFARDKASFAKDCFAIDLICGKQLTTQVGRGEKTPKFEVFGAALRDAITEYAISGGNILVSGANIATDLWAPVYPVVRDSADLAAARSFVVGTLGCKYQSDHGTNRGTVSGMEFFTQPNSQSYWVENPDAIAPAVPAAKTVLLYDGTFRSAAVHYDAANYRTAVYGFPIEVLKSEADRRRVIGEAMDFFKTGF